MAQYIAANQPSPNVAFPASVLEPPTGDPMSFFRSYIVPLSDALPPPPLTSLHPYHHPINTPSLFITSSSSFPGPEVRVYPPGVSDTGVPSNTSPVFHARKTAMEQQQQQQQQQVSVVLSFIVPILLWCFSVR